MRRYALVILAALLLISLLLVSGCKAKRTMISSILERPDHYMDRTVKVAGEVRKTYAVNLFIAEAGAYQVDDGSGTIWVITRVGVPREGSEVGLKGHVSGGLKIAGETFGAVIREEERRTRN